MLLMKLARQLQQVIGAAGIDRILVRRRISNRSRHRGGDWFDGSSDRGFAESGQRLRGELSLLRRDVGRRCLSQSRGLRGTALKLADTRLARDKALAKFFVLLVETTELHNDFVQEIIDLILVVSFAELGRLESLVDYIFRRKSHGFHLKKFIWYSASYS